MGFRVCPGKRTPLRLGEKSSFLSGFTGLAVIIVLSVFAGPVQAVPRVVATIKPLHSLVAGVMEGVGTPDLIVKGGTSPHLYSLRPSDIHVIDRGDLVVWIGAAVETFLIRYIKAVENKTAVVSPLNMHGVVLLSRRRGTRWESGYDQIGSRIPNPTDVHTHADPHVWLDPRNASEIVKGLVAVLALIDPRNGRIYVRNGKAMRLRLANLDRELRTILSPHKDRVYVVYHDAYQYFERRYGLSPQGSVTLHPESQPSPKRISEIQKLVQTGQAICVFSEPQFKLGIVQRLVESGHFRHGVLDPIGAGLEPGPDLYFTLLRGLGSAIADCFTNTGTGPTTTRDSIDQAVPPEMPRSRAKRPKRSRVDRRSAITVVVRDLRPTRLER